METETVLKQAKQAGADCTSKFKKVSLQKRDGVGGGDTFQPENS